MAKFGGPLHSTGLASWNGTLLKYLMVYIGKLLFC